MYKCYINSVIIIIIIIIKCIFEEFGFFSQLPVSMIKKPPFSCLEFVRVSTRIQY